MMLPFLKARIGGADIDMMPNPFAFPTAGGQAPNVLVTSAVVQITGISVPVPVTVNVGQFRVLDATQTVVIQDWGTVGSIKRGQCLQLRQTSSNTYSGTVSMGVNVGKASVVWYVTTVAVSGGSAGWGTPGQYAFTIPHHNSFNFDVYGAGAGAGGFFGLSDGPSYNAGAAGNGGGYSQIYDEETGGGKVNVIGWTGGGGPGQYFNGAGFVVDGNGAAGGAQGGDGNIAGGGAGGGAPGYSYWSYNPGQPFWGSAGGPGGRAYRGIGRGLLTPGTRLIINVGAAGSRGGNGYSQYGDPFYAYGGEAGNGACYISWG